MSILSFSITCKRGSTSSKLKSTHSKMKICAVCKVGTPKTPLLILCVVTIIRIKLGNFSYIFVEKWKEVPMNQRMWHLNIVCKSYEGSKVTWIFNKTHDKWNCINKELSPKRYEHPLHNHVENASLHTYIGSENVS